MLGQGYGWSQGQGFIVDPTSYHCTSLSFHGNRNISHHQFLRYKTENLKIQGHGHGNIMGPTCYQFKSLSSNVNGTIQPCSQWRSKRCCTSWEFTSTSWYCGCWKYGVWIFPQPSPWFLELQGPKHDPCGSILGGCAKWGPADSTHCWGGPWVLRMSLISARDGYMVQILISERNKKLICLLMIAPKLRVSGAWGLYLI